MRSRKHAQTRPSPVPIALLLIDVLTTFQFPDGEAILRGALKMRDALVKLKSRAREVGVPVLYVNDTSATGAAKRKCCWVVASKRRAPGSYGRYCRIAKIISC